MASKQHRRGGQAEASSDLGFGREFTNVEWTQDTETSPATMRQSPPAIWKNRGKPSWTGSPSPDEVVAGGFVRINPGQAKHETAQTCEGPYPQGLPLAECGLPGCAQLTRKRRWVRSSGQVAARTWPDERNHPGTGLDPTRELWVANFGFVPYPKAAEAAEAARSFGHFSEKGEQLDEQLAAPAAAAARLAAARLAAATARLAAATTRLPARRAAGRARGAAARGAAAVAAGAAVRRGA